MAVTPQTDLYLIQSPLESDNLNQLTFTSASDQSNYFSNLPHLLVQNFTYQRKDNVIRYPGHIDSIQTYNYVMYRNNNYTNKYFYAFITRMEYVNDNMTNIYIKTDVYQSWMFNITFKQSFVEREHVNDDTIGLHTVPENLETGEYVANSKVDLFTGSSSTTACIMCSDLPDAVHSETRVVLPTFNGAFSGLYILVADPETPAQSISNFLRAMDEIDKADAVVSIFIIPTNLIPDGITYKVYTTEGISYKIGILPDSNGAKLLNTSSSFTVPSTLNGYTPKNNKLKTYPYSYFYISNNVGSDVEFHYEDFTNNTAQFKTLGAITPGCSIRCVPISYKKLTDTSGSYNSFNAGISVGKYPICAWQSDVYTNWLTENGVNIGLQVIGGVGAIGLGIAGIATGAGALAGVGGITAGIGAISSAIATTYQHSLTPDQAKGNTNTGDVTFSAGQIDAVAFKMSVRSEYAKIIDDFFSMYGYKVNTLKVPNTTGRSNWNYVKTIGANIEGNIPQDDIEELKGIFNNGVTLWHNTSTYLDYSQNNDII